jgi:hypothetical protein
MKSHPSLFAPRNRQNNIKQIIAEIGEENYNYILNHHGKQKRNVIAKKTGILKFNLNQYYIKLFPQEAM